MCSNYFQATQGKLYISGAENKVVPGESEGIGARDGVGSGALTHAVQLVQRDVQAEEEL